MTEVKGYVDHTIYRNADNGYTVMILITDGDEITVTGNFPAAMEGESLILQGDFVNHATYGQQFKAVSYSVTAPDDEAGIERYLASGAVKGVGPALAKKIVKKFKRDTLRIMEEEPERLAEIKGISERKAMEIADIVAERKDLRDAMLFLGKYGISTNLSIKIYNEYGPLVYRIIEENPYRMAEEIPGVGFKTADEIAGKVGISVDSDFRIQSGILYVLSQAAANGNTYLPADILIHETENLLSVDGEHIRPHIMNLSILKKVMVKKDRVYSMAFYHMEDASASMLLSMADTFGDSEERILSAISDIEKGEDIELDRIQRDAVIAAATHGVTVITGGPGTGKTTIIKALLKYYEKEGYDVLLAAPTGRAAKRMSEATGYEAATIHRMLEVSGGLDDERRGKFSRNDENPLETDVVIVDEMSMVDITLFYALLKAMVPGMRLILVGDQNQLPSVGPGNVLKDIIQSGAVPVVTLKKIFRQEDTGDIVVNAHKINRGEEVDPDNNSKDFFLMKRYDADVITAVSMKLINENLPKYVEAGPLDIQVLTPSRKGLLGVENLNTVIQEKLNPPAPGKPELKYGERIFRVGDKVMQNRNDYNAQWEILGKYNIPVETGNGVFNGDMGIVTDVDTVSKTVTVVFDENRTVKYQTGSLDDIELSYAITIHKAQGSEYPAVVIPLLPGPKMLYTRNLLYTAVTRAKKCVVIVGDDNTFKAMIRNNTETERYSGLKERIMECQNMESSTGQ